MCAWKWLRSTHDRLVLPSGPKPPFACHWPRGLSIWTVPAPLRSRVPKPHFSLMTIGRCSSPSSSYSRRLVLRAGSPPSLPPGLEDSGEGGWWGRGPEAVVPALAAAAEAFLGRSRAVSLGPGTDPSKAAEFPDPRSTWSVGGPREVVRLGREVPSVLAPTELGAAWALDPHPRGNAHLLPDPQETPEPFSLLCVSGATKAGPSAPVLLGHLWVSLPISRPFFRAPYKLSSKRTNVSVSPLRSTVEASQGPIPRSWARFHPRVSSSLLPPPPSLVSATWLYLL